MSAPKNGVSFLSACGNGHVAVVPDLSEGHDMRLTFSWAGEEPETFFMKTDFARHLAEVLADVADQIEPRDEPEATEVDLTGLTVHGLVVDSTGLAVHGVDGSVTFKFPNGNPLPTYSVEYQDAFCDWRPSGVVVGTSSSLEEARYAVFKSGVDGVEYRIVDSEGNAYPIEEPTYTVERFQTIRGGWVSSLRVPGTYSSLAQARNNISMFGTAGVVYRVVDSEGGVYPYPAKESS